MSVSRGGFALATSVVAVAALISAAGADTVTGFLYASDYGSQALDRFSYQYNTVTNVISDIQAYGVNGSTTNAKFITSNVKEGLQGTESDIIVVDTGGNSLSRYTLQGALIGSIAIKNADGSAHALNSVGNVAITPDGKYMYAPESSGNVIDKIDLATGKIVASAPFKGAHDVLILPNGNILAAAYSNNSTSGTDQSNGIWRFDSNLSAGSKTQIIADGDNGLSRPTGMSLSKDGTTLYIQKNVQNNNNSVYEYTINSLTGAATFSKKNTYANLAFDFGTDIGPDGNLYIAALGSGKTQASFTSPADYVNGIYEYNTTTDVVSQAVAGYDNATSSPTDNFYSPKYIQFGFNFISAPDAGYQTTPEPGTVGLLSGLLISGAVSFAARRKRRSA